MVLRIVVIKDDRPIDQFVVTGNKTSIGRKSECDISIKDPAISGNHAEIQAVKDRFVIQDLGSTNGIHIGGRKVMQYVLKDGDLISIGEHQMRVALTEGELGEKARLQKAAREKAADTTLDDDKTQISVSSGEGHLMVLNGKQAGEQIALNQALTTVGEPGVQVAAISKRPQGHFIIHVDGGKDKDRVPLVNGEPTGFKSRKLEPGDKIEVADIKMEYIV